MLIERLKYYPDLYQLALIYRDCSYTDMGGGPTLADAFVWNKTMEGWGWWEAIRGGRFPVSELGLFERVDNQYENPIS